MHMSSHFIHIQSILNPFETCFFFRNFIIFFQHLRVCFHPHGILPLGFSFNGRLGWSIPSLTVCFDSHQSLTIWTVAFSRNHKQFSQVNTLWDMEVLHLAVFSGKKQKPRALRVKAEAPEQFLPESFNFPKETPHGKNSMWRFFQLQPWYQFDHF